MFWFSSVDRTEHARGGSKGLKWEDVTVFFLVRKQLQSKMGALSQTARSKEEKKNNKTYGSRNSFPFPPSSLSYFPRF